MEPHYNQQLGQHNQPTKLAATWPLAERRLENAKMANVNTHGAIDVKEGERELTRNSKSVVQE